MAISPSDVPRLGASSCNPYSHLNAMGCLQPYLPSCSRPKTSVAIEAVLEVTVKGLEASKDAVVAVALIPGLSVAFSLIIELLKKIQVSTTHHSTSSVHNVFLSRRRG